MKTTRILGVLLLAPLMMSSIFAAKTELESAQKLAGMWVIKAGTTATDFGLSQTITRKEMMKIVMNLSGKNVPDSCNGDFSDVTNDWGCKYIESALSSGFIAANATFRPDDSISKAEAMKLILKARGIEKAYNTTNWQDDYMQTAFDYGLVSSTYSDHNNAALRGWIFSVGAAQEDMMKKDDNESEDVMIKEGDVMEKDEGEVMMKKEAAGYKDYDSSLLGTHENVVLFFHTSWCPSCRSADSNITETGVDDFLLLKVDYDSHSDLKKKYGVTYQHTFVQVDQNGEMIQKWNGGNTVESIQAKIQ